MKEDTYKYESQKFKLVAKRSNSVILKPISKETSFVLFTKENEYFCEHCIEGSFIISKEIFEEYFIKQ